MSVLTKHNLLMQIAIDNQDILHDPGVLTKYFRKTTGQIISGLLKLEPGYSLINDIGGGFLNDNRADSIMDESEITFHVITPASESVPENHVEKIDACQAVAFQCVRRIYELVDGSGPYKLIEFDLSKVSYDEMPIEVYGTAVGCMIRARAIFFDDNLNYNPAKWP